MTGTCGLRGAHEGARIRSAFPNSLLVALVFFEEDPSVCLLLVEVHLLQRVVRPPFAGPGGKGCWDGLVQGREAEKVSSFPLVVPGLNE